MEWMALKETKTLPEAHPDPRNRPSMQEFQRVVWDALREADSESYVRLRRQVEFMEGHVSSVEPWEHMDRKLEELDAFYRSM